MNTEVIARPHLTDEERDYYSLNKKVYAVFAKFYELVVLPLRGVRREVARLAGIDANARVLDVATGTGAQARAFAEMAREVVGIDLAEAMLEVARRMNPRSNLLFRQADATALPFGDATFDVSSISFALHEMPASVRRRAALEMARVTKPGGKVVVVDYGRPPGPWGDLLFRVVKLYERDHYADFIASDVTALLDGAGCDVTKDRSLLRGAVRVIIAQRRTGGSR